MSGLGGALIGMCLSREDQHLEFDWGPGNGTLAEWLASITPR
jgi:hypothetical protein